MTTAEITYRTLDGENASLPASDVDILRGGVRGGVGIPGDPIYEEGRRLWNAMVDHHPALTARCISAEDVRHAVRFAHERSMLLSVRGGGHHIAGNAVAEGGLTLDLSGMRSTRVDRESRTARVFGGALLGDFDHETQGHGLATPMGINSTTGVAGLTLGGGFGWLTRAYGLSIDNLESVDIVTADGELRVASASQDPDLFWAVRGGGGNFGVATSFEFRLHPVGPLVYSGPVVYPAAQAETVLRAWRDFNDTAPDELSAWAVLRKAPPLPFLPPAVHGTDVVVLAILYVGDIATGAREAAPLLELGTPLGSALGPKPYAAFQAMFDPLLAPGARNYWKTNEFDALSDDALNTFIEGAFCAPAPDCEVFIAQLGGAMGRVPRDATAYDGRDTAYVMNVHGRWHDRAEDATCRSWARNVFDSTTPFANGGGYVNFLTGDESARVSSAYGDNYERLRSLKRTYDPDNLFRMNHNIPPGEADDRGPVRGARRRRERPGQAG